MGPNQTTVPHYFISAAKRDALEQVEGKKSAWCQGDVNYLRVVDLMTPLDGLIFCFLDKKRMFRNLDRDFAGLHAAGHWPRPSAGGQSRLAHVAPASGEMRPCTLAAAVAPDRDREDRGTAKPSEDPIPLSKASRIWL